MGYDSVDGGDGGVSPQERKDAAFAARPNAVQAAGASRRARGPVVERGNDDEGSSFSDDVDERKLRKGSLNAPSSSSTSRRGPRHRPPSQFDPSSAASPPPPPIKPSSSSSSATAAPPASDLDAFRSRPRLGVDEEIERSAATTEEQQQQQLSKGRKEPKHVSPPATRRKIAPQPEQMDSDAPRDAGPREDEQLVGKMGGGAVGIGEEEGDADLRLVSCGNCGRRFAEDRVAKHEKACSSQKARKQYDTKKHRVLGQDHANYALDDKYQKDEVTRNIFMISA